MTAETYRNSGADRFQAYRGYPELGKLRAADRQKNQDSVPVQ